MAASPRSTHQTANTAPAQASLFPRLSAILLGLVVLGGLTLAPRAARSQGWDWPEDVSGTSAVCTAEQLQTWKTGQKVACMGLPTT